MKVERIVVPFEVKAEESAERTFSGYASVFGTIDSYADIVAKGAFKRSLKEWKAKGRSPAMLWQHDPSEPVGVWAEMREDDHGLFVTGQLADTQRGREAHTLLKMGALSGLSIGFRTRKSTLDDETGIRTLTDVDLWETSLVTFPANDPARVTAVKADGELPTEREFERWLRREAGFTERQAKTLIAKGYRQVRREAMPSETNPCDELVALIQQGTAIFDTGVKDDGHGSLGRQGGHRDAESRV